MNALDRHRALLAAATPLPWNATATTFATTRSGRELPCRDQYSIRTHYRFPIPGHDESCVAPFDMGGGFTEQDARFIAAAVNAHPLLLDLWAAAKKLDDVMDRREKLPDMEFDKLEGEMVETIQSVRDILAKLEAMQ